MYTYNDFEKDARAIFCDIIEDNNLLYETSETHFKMISTQYQVFFILSPFELGGFIKNSKSGEVVRIDHRFAQDAGNEILRPDFRSIQSHIVWELKRYKAILLEHFFPNPSCS